LIAGDDGGIWYSYDGGNKWWKGENLPISQFYHVSVDMEMPYRVYGGLQDNSSWVGDSQYPGGITNSRWENMYGGDGFWMFVDPTDTDYIYAEYQGGNIARINRQNTKRRAAFSRCRNTAKANCVTTGTLRFTSPKAGTLYLGSQYLFRSKDKGSNVGTHLAGSNDERPGKTKTGIVRRHHG
jgi:hypothetical protein